MHACVYVSIYDIRYDYIMDGMVYILCYTLCTYISTHTYIYIYIYNVSIQLLMQTGFWGPKLHTPKSVANSKSSCRQGSTSRDGLKVGLRV